MSKQLPERADLEHLKGQAKSLLATLRETQPDAKLSDAQLSLAREYGFPSWSKLKRHVEGLRDRRTAFFHALRGGDRDAARRLLEEDRTLCHVTDPTHFDIPAIAVAANRGDRKMIDLLIEFGADIDARSTWWAGGFGALDSADEATSKYLIGKGAKLTAHAAARLGMVEELRAILRTHPEAVHVRGGDGQFPLHFAKTPEIVDLLVDAGADQDARDIDHEATAAQWRIEDAAVLRRLLERGASPDIYMAVMLEDLPLMERLAQADPECLERTQLDGTDPMIPIAPGMHIYIYNIGMGRPFQVALKHGKQAAYRWLMERASPKQRLLAACWNGDRSADQDRRLVSELNARDMALLPEAAWERKTDSVRMMLELGFDPNVTGVHHSSAIDRAAFHGFADVIEAILPYGPDLTIRNEFGGTPLGACLYGSLHSWRKDGNFVRSVELLVDAGATIPEKAVASPEVMALLERKK